MTQQYVSVRVPKFIKENFNVIEQTIRRHHPEYDGMQLTNGKIILEMQKQFVKLQKEQPLLKLSN